MSKTCKECGARCCRYFCFEIDKPTSFEEFENVRWFLMHEGVAVHIDTDGDWYIAIINRCRNLLPNLRCRQYSRRPLICRSYNIEGCDFTQGNYEYQALFTTPEQIENYARMKLGPARHDRIRKKAYAKVIARRPRREARSAWPPGTGRKARFGQAKAGNAVRRADGSFCVRLLRCSVATPPSQTTCLGVAPSTAGTVALRTSGSP